MAFSTRRGRPARAKDADVRDAGTPELQFKRALGLTSEPIDQCLERGVITPDHHWCGLHLRWLYTLRYGAPVITTRYADAAPATVTEETPEWRSEREHEYQDAVRILQQAGRYECVMRLCVFNELPVFLNVSLASRALQEPALARQLHQRRITLNEGLELLIALWRPRTPHAR
jgi:hypothetical protein